MKNLILVTTILINSMWTIAQQKTIDSAQWAQMARMIAQQKSTDSLQWAYIANIVHVIIPQDAKRVDSIVNALRANTPWGFLPASSMIEGGTIIMAYGFEPLSFPDTGKPPLKSYQPYNWEQRPEPPISAGRNKGGIKKKSQDDNGPYVLAWDIRSHGYRIAYVYENEDDVKWLAVKYPKEGEYIGLATGFKEAELFYEKKEAIEAIHKHWKQVKASQKENSEGPDPRIQTIPL